MDQAAKSNDAGRVEAAGNGNRAPRWTMTFILAQDSDVTRKCREGIGGKEKWDPAETPVLDQATKGNGAGRVEAAGNGNRAPRWTMTFILAQDSDVTRKCREGIGGKT